MPVRRLRLRDGYAAFFISAARCTNSRASGLFGRIASAFGGERGRDRLLAGAQRGLDQREVEYVALGVAAAEAVRDVAHLAQPPNRLRVVAVAEGLDRQHHRMADLAYEGGVVAIALHRLLLRLDHARERLLPAGADESHRRVRVVEGVVAGVLDRLPGVRHRLPAVADVDAAQVQPPQHRGGVDHFEDHARLRAVDRTVEQLEHLVDLAEIEMIERDVPPVVDREEAVARPAVGVGRHPGDALLLAALHLHHMRDGVLRPGVAALERDRGAAARPRRRRSRRSPRDRKHAFRASA